MTYLLLFMLKAGCVAIMCACWYRIGYILGQKREFARITAYHRATVDRLASERGYYSPSLTEFIAGVKGLEHRK